MTVQQWLIILLNVVRLLKATWISPTSKMPYKVSEFAVGSYNNTIFILGGQGTNQQRIIEYQISTDAFIDLGETILTEEIRGEAQFWVQKEEILYMIKPRGNSRIVTFNMKTRQYTEKWNNILFNTDVGNGGCLAASNDHLFVIGGTSSSMSSYDGFDTLQVLSTETNEWIQNAPTMQQNRTDHACIVHKDILWVFGGLDIKSLKTNEYIEINDITQNVWEYIAPLTDESNGLRVIAFEDDIYIIGGKNKGTGIVHDTIHIYNVITRTMTLSDDRLPYGVRYMGSIMVHNVMYLFGGYRPCEPCGGYEVTDQWMYTGNATYNDSTNPSAYPTKATTHTTVFPTESTTEKPLKTPSTAPSHITKYIIYSLVILICIVIAIGVLIYSRKRTRVRKVANNDVPGAKKEQINNKSVSLNENETNMVTEGVRTIYSLEVTEEGKQNNVDGLKVTEEGSDDERNVKVDNDDCNITTGNVTINCDV